MIIQRDWEEDVYEQRLMIVPEDVAVRACEHVPSVAAQRLLKLHDDPAFRAQCVMPKISYPEDLVKRVLDQENLLERVRKQEKAALADSRVEIRRNTGLLSRFVAMSPDFLQTHMPSTYMTESVTRATRQVSADFARTFPPAQPEGRQRGRDDGRRRRRAPSEELSDASPVKIRKLPGWCSAARKRQELSLAQQLPDVCSPSTSPGESPKCATFPDCVPDSDASADGMKVDMPSAMDLDNADAQRDRDQDMAVVQPVS